MLTKRNGMVSRGIIDCRYRQENENSHQELREATANNERRQLTTTDDKNMHQVDRSKIREVMQELSQGSEHRPAQERIRDIYPDIEIALQKKVRRKVIWERLKDLGIDITFKNFEAAIRRLKKERSKEQTKTRTTSHKSSGAQEISAPTTNPLKNLKKDEKKATEFSALPQTPFEVDRESDERKDQDE